MVEHFHEYNFSFLLYFNKKKYKAKMPQTLEELENDDLKWNEI